MERVPSQTATIPVNRPKLPSADHLLPYLREIDHTRYYANFGPLHQRLANRLATYFGIDCRQLGLAASGTAALTGLILATAGRASASKPYCICPSYTFAATALAIEACGYQPVLADIGRTTLALEPERIAELPELERSALVVLVAPYGQAPELGTWKQFSLRTGVQVIIDAAACFDTIDVREVCAGPLAVALSLHATKTFSTAEGGIMLASDTRLVERALAALNFGFLSGRDCAVPSINGKLSEYHAAIGLAELDGWAEKRQAYLRVAATYSEAAAAAGLSHRVVVDTQRANPYALFLASDADEASIIGRALNNAAIDWRLWYGRGLHRQTYFNMPGSHRFPITDAVSPAIIGLPFAIDLGRDEVDRVIRAVASVCGGTAA